MSRGLNVARSLSAALLLTQCVVANALFTTPETETFNLSISGLTLTVTDGVLPGTTQGTNAAFKDLTFDKFNSGLGDLIGVELTYTSKLGTKLSLDVKFSVTDNQTDGSFGLSGTNELKLTGAGLIPTTKLTTSCTYPGDFTPNCLKSDDPGSVDINSLSPISLTPLADFLAPGTFVLTATLGSSMTPDIVPDIPDIFFADNSTLTGTLSANWEGSVSVRYEYRERSSGAVPEPMTLYLLLAGVAGIALLRRGFVRVHAKR